MNFLNKTFLIIASVLCLSKARIIQNGKNNIDTTSTGTFDDDSLRKNDDSHLRLYYKSNSPDRSISHELEHRLLKNPSIQYANRIQPESNFQTKFQFPLSMNYLDPRSNIFSAFKPNDIFQSTNRNKQTLLNLHYHGNSIPGLDTTLNQISDHQKKLQQAEIQRKYQALNLLKTLLANFSPAQQMFSLPRNFHQSRFETIKPNNDLNYKVLNLKLKIQPDQGRIFGNGYIQTENQDGWFNSNKASVLPRELPEIIKRLVSSSQSLNNNEAERTSFLKKRNDDEFKTKFSDDSNFEKRDQYERNSVESKDKTKLNGESDFYSNDEEKINENELNESFKSLQRRDNLEYEDNSLKNLSINENEMDSKESSNEN